MYTYKFLSRQLFFERFEAHEGEYGVRLVLDIYFYIVFQAFYIEYFIEVDLRNSDFGSIRTIDVLFRRLAENRNKRKV